MSVGIFAGIMAAAAGGGGGGGGGSVSISDQAISDTDLSAGSAQAGYIINSNGDVERNGGGSITTLETWLLSGVNSDFQVRATLSSGDTPTGSLGSWNACSSTHSWSVSANGGGGASSSCVLLIELREATSPFTVLDSASVSLTATSNDPL